MRHWIGTRAIALACLAIALDAVVLRRFLFDDSVPPGLEQGWFESLAGKTVLATGPRDAQIVPAIGLFASAHEIGVPAGMTATLGIDPAFAVKVQTVSGQSIPYLVLGRRTAVPPDAAFDGFSGTRRADRESYLDQPRSLQLDGDGRLKLLPWDIDATLDADRSRLASIAAVCLTASEPRQIVVRREGNDLFVEIGKCVARADEVSGGAGILAMVAGPESTRVERLDGQEWMAPQHWKAQSAILFPFLVLRYVAVAYAFGAGAAVLSSGALAVSGARFAYEALAVLLLLTVVGGVRSLILLFTRAPRPVRWGLAACAASGLALLTMDGFARRDPPAAPRIEGTRGAGSRCIVMGYSTAAGATLEDFGSNGVYEWLANTCGPCRTATSRVAQKSADFEFIRDSLCSAEFPGGDNADVLLLGGTNDDFFWALKPRASLSWLASLLTGGRLLFNHGWQHNPDAVVDPQASVNAMAQNTAGQAELQIDAVRDALECADQRHVRFHFFHDFMIYDVPGGRMSAARRAMLTKRQEMTEAGRGVFVDLLDVTRAEVGVSWFNDQIHLSAVGHRRMADIICASLMQSRVAREFGTGAQPNG
jgi:hypothetical protein